MGSARGIEERIDELEEQLGAFRLRLELVETGVGVPQPHVQAATIAARSLAARLKPSLSDDTRRAWRQLWWRSCQPR